MGVQRDATQRQIKLAYYQLSKKYHPDVAGRDADTQSKFIEITEAYDCLKDPERRRIYDGSTIGRGGRYTGDPYDFKDFRQYSSGQRRGNPFYSRQYTQQEYERIWQEFNRMRSERETYDQRVRQEGQKIWEQFARERATRWQQFHSKYPSGAPGSFRYEWRWRAVDPGTDRTRTMIARLVLFYSICFLVVTVFQLIFEPYVDKAASAARRGMRTDTTKEKKNDFDFSYMNLPPQSYSDSSWANVASNTPSSSELLDSGFSSSAVPRM
ncbi:unnamed protein product [Heligmosomoides polygyrus]|uniref:J domain-containing protein n=1 Tax=Heligmosomoides polygyrus TaxID=6339 RepID=A0A3P8E9P9_HELPZ|nr:unnamed protein product [Heligmosomoides polygyrus]